MPQLALPAARRRPLLALLAVPLGAGAQAPTAAPTGSWQVLYEPDPGGPFERSFAGLWTFGADGTLLVTDQPPTRRRTPDGARPLFGLGHGAWAMDSGEARFLFRQYAFPASSPPDISAAITVRGSLVVGAEAWGGRFSVEAFDGQGALLARGAGRLTARAIRP